MREVLASLVRDCKKCDAIFSDNVALIADENGNLTDKQVASVLEYLSGLHGLH